MFLIEERALHGINEKREGPGMSYRYDFATIMPKISRQTCRMKYTNSYGRLRYVLNIIMMMAI